MSKQAQVYIATTQGLVRIQAISVLGAQQTGPLIDSSNTQSLRSLVTINKTVQTAGISHDYASFVAPPQGIIQGIFGGQAYRLNIERTIDVGNSWQLGAYIAHALHANQQLCEQTQSSSIEDTIEQNNTIFIATGAINTVDLSIMEVSALAQKTRTAAAQIKQWQAEGKNLRFFVPKENFKQALPDLAMSLTAVDSIKQMHQVLSALGFVDLPAYAVGQQHMLAEDTPSSLEPVKASTKDLSKPKNTNTVTIEALESEKSPMVSKSWLIAALTLSVLSILLWIINSNHQPTLDTAFEMQAGISANRANCDLADTHVLKSGELGLLQQIQPTRLQHLCDLSLITSDTMLDVWLLSNNGKIIVLDNSAKAKNLFGQAQKQWHIPMPSQQEQNRAYYLLVFAKSVDQADQQSLAHYLQALYSQNKTDANTSFYTSSDLSMWAKKMNLPVYFLSHELFI